ncbi:MAG TPA: cadmium-translocating P-type ATPase [Candidatus Methanoperedenaceae archaeon]|nr:cadmium-translocating P-type ATPase [Candidatus Methanoperedenaceae archaeon]
MEGNPAGKSIAYGTDEVEESGFCPECSLGEYTGDTRWKREGALIIIASTVFLALGLYIDKYGGGGMAADLLLLSAGAVAGYRIVWSGLRSLWKRRPDMNCLMTLAAAGAFYIGHGEEGASVLYLFFIAEFLEEYAEDRARSSIGMLIRLTPDTATVRRAGAEVTVHVHEVDAGETAVVRPGEKIPLDGIVISGESDVSQAAITGEAMPVRKQEADPVYAGTLNGNGYLVMRVTRRSGETVLSKIVSLIEAAEKKKSRTERLIDRFSRVYTPAVISLALLVAVLPPLAFSQPWDEWLYRALVLLVISCPCALAISTPVSMVSGITGAARNGVLVKGGNYIEELGSAGVFVFDKTGTLTEGRPAVTDIEASGASSGKEILSIAASIEAMSAHPLAQAIVERARADGIVQQDVSGFEYYPGKGVAGNIGGIRYYAGSPAMFRELTIGFPEERVLELEDEGKTVILAGKKGDVGIIAVMDRIRDASEEAVQGLRKRGVRIVMLTGDNERIAGAVARKLGIDEYRAGLMPADKVKVIEGLNDRYGRTVMVGDGVNDAPALAGASVGIAMGAIGSDVALETADIALMHDDLSKLPYLLDHSRKTMEVVRENVIASVGVKAGFAVLAIPGFITLWMAVGAGDMGLSLLVILNAMRLSAWR